jgi:hypothetical protein
MYNPSKPSSTSIKVNAMYEGESIETKVRRIVENKEPIQDSAPLVYTNREDGVLPAYNIRTDRFEVAIEAMDTVAKGKLAQRDAKEKKEKTPPAETTGENPVI